MIQDIPNWVGLLLELLLALGLYVIDRRATKRDELTRTEVQTQNQRQIEHMTGLVEAIKSTLDEGTQSNFNENMTSFFHRRAREIMYKYQTLWEGYLENNAVRLGGRFSREIAILGTNLLDLISRAKDTLSDEDITVMKDLAYEYDRFGNRFAYLGDQKEFETTGADILEKTNSTLEQLCDP